LCLAELLKPERFKSHMDHREIGSYNGSFKGQNWEERELRRKYVSHMIGIIIIPKV